MLLKCTDLDVSARRASEVTQTNSQPCAASPAGIFAAFQGWGARIFQSSRAGDRELSVVSLLGGCGNGQTRSKLPAPMLASISPVPEQGLPAETPLVSGIIHPLYEYLAAGWASPEADAR